MPEYTTAPKDVTEVVTRIFEECHADRLAGAKVAVICQDKASKRGGKRILGDASKPSARLRPLLDDSYDFVICIALDAWEDASPAKRAALIDHELCHCHVDPSGVCKIVPHDMEEFIDVVHRRGLDWRADGTGAAFQQALFSEVAGVSAPVVEERKVDGK